MAAAKKGGGGDMVLESRHLFGLFVLLAVLFGVVFTLGYLLGRGQGDSQAHVAAIRADDSAAASDAAAPSPSADAPAADKKSSDSAPSATGTDWSYYHSGDPGPANDVLEPAAGTKPSRPAKPAASSSTSASKAATGASTTKATAKPAASATPAAAVTSPLVPSGAIVLQVAALEKESDALAMAQALQQRKFPAFVLPAGADQYFRVQVGPYATEQAAAAAQKQLESQGFKSIVKR